MAEFAAAGQYKGMTAKEYAAHQTRRRRSTRSHSGNNAGAITPTIGRTLSAEVAAARRRRSVSGNNSPESKASSPAGSPPAGAAAAEAAAVASPAAATSAGLRKRQLQGWYSGTGGAVGVYIRIELEFPTDVTTSATGAPCTVWVWSTATDDFNVPDCDFNLVDKGQGKRELIFEPKLQRVLRKKTVVTKITAVWDPEDDSIAIVVTIKLGWAVPGFDIKTTCIGVGKAVGAVNKTMKMVRRTRPY